ncbi:MAG: rod shape-determining protein MreC [Planctomycetota bacterium JB042]
MILGLALLSLTPAAPSFLRRPELMAVHAYRPLDLLRREIGETEAEEEGLGFAPELAARIEAGLSRWDELLLGGAGGGGVVARIVAIDRVRRRLLIDAGEGVRLAAGDAVTAGRYALGVVVRAESGMAVVDMPWTPDARFAGAAEDATGAEVRLILAGLDRLEWTASVSHPERLSALRVDGDVRVPEVDDLLPASVPRLPPGLVLGSLRIDELLRRTGTEAFRVVPTLDVRGLDAVCVRTSGAAAGGGAAGFERREVGALACGLASPGRDGLVLTGLGLPDGAAVTWGGMFVGSVEAAAFGAARVRGVFDPGQDRCVVVLSARRSGPIVVRTLRAWRGGGRLRVGSEQTRPEVGDLLVTAGRGDHVPRGLFIGAVVRVDGETIDVLRGEVSADAPVVVLRRRGMPDDPWRDD